MRLMDITKRIAKNYFIVFALIVICLTVLRQFFSTGKYFELKEIYIYMICACISIVPSLIFYSPEELSGKKYRIRVILHFAALEAVLLTFGHVTGLVNDVANTAILAVQVAVIYGVVRLLTYMEDRKSSNKINEKLKTMKVETSIVSEQK
ncbi:DUF3021 family protein [Paenibacillus sp. SN-8-1]|uniref:DUF3021 family protein n=1 Tax=Paenibacillus sp. SN-8-1 TaxID=3435409 RepID=UPI003D9A1018